MSGHSKWHNIQGRKGKQDSLRSNAFTKIAKMITVAAQKGSDPTMNFSLRLAIDKAKDVGMPKDNIDRAIKRGSGELGDNIQMEQLLYEGFGPGGIAVLIKAVTDNKNRAVSDIKHILTKYGGSLGSSGSVQWMFEECAIIALSKNQITNQDETELALIEAGANDIQTDEEEIMIKTTISNLQKLLTTVKDLGFEPARSGVEWLAKEKVKVDDETRPKLENLFGELEENDDVEEYFTNAN